VSDGSEVERERERGSERVRKGEGRMTIICEDSLLCRSVDRLVVREA
jgi:hypothetical protein